MRRITACCIVALLIAALMTGCATDGKKDLAASKAQETGKLQIVATLFPQYDFARQVAGDKADVILLLPPGVESHSYEPTPSDVMKINESDLFLYTGKNMEAWSQKIIDAMKDSGSHSVVLDVSKGISLVKTEDEEGHTEEADAESAGENAHEHLYDPHIWTDPVYAAAMTENIREALCGLDPGNAEYYTANAEKYEQELDSLDQEFRKIVKNGSRQEILFGSRFAFYYFAKRYGLDYKSAFDSCSSETEPSARAVAALVEEVKAKGVPVIYYAELEEPKVAKSISAETGAKMLLLHSCHNVTREELENGATYLSLMRQNAQNLKKGLE